LLRERKQELGKTIRKDSDASDLPACKGMLAVWLYKTVIIFI